ncbi:MAG: nicotinamide riboside transporter PnuC [Bacteroidales bacterium]|nr:nicotinamide riboside transporter PnuC [Bacteroidales bacterium]
MLIKIINWLSTHAVELTGSILGILYVLYASRQNIWCWLLGIISCALYIIVFFTAKLYGDMSLQVFYLVLGFYGWYSWLKKTKDDVNPAIKNTSKVLFIWVLISVLIMTLGFGYLLTFTDDPIPYWDGFTNALGITGTWMTARKYIENWLLWIFANLVCVGVYMYKGLYPTVVFYLIMTLLAYRAYLIWYKELNAQKHA